MTAQQEPGEHFPVGRGPETLKLVREILALLRQRRPDAAESLCEDACREDDSGAALAHPPSGMQPRQLPECPSAEQNCLWADVLSVAYVVALAIGILALVSGREPGRSVQGKGAAATTAAPASESTAASGPATRDR